LTSSDWSVDCCLAVGARRVRVSSGREINKGDEIARHAGGDSTVRDEYTSSIALWILVSSAF